MYKIRLPFFLILLIVLNMSQLFGAQNSIHNNNISTIIPKPQKFFPGNGEFTLTTQTQYFSDTSLSKNAISYLQKHLKQNSGYLLRTGRSSKNNTIHFLYNPKKIHKSEAYRLQIEKDQVTIEARDQAGFFYAVVSLMQLMDASIWSQSDSNGGKKTWDIPSCMIEDHPRFAWRGMMLDTSRNFFSISYIKKFIDRMAQHKLNRFHWHLTDDEAWRIEIKQYLLLTQIGAHRGPGTKLPFSTYPAMRGPKNKRQSGYYTQDEIKEIVAYAQARSIEILPEIDMPGHAKAAIISYPELLQDPKDKSDYHSVQKISNNTVNPGMESTYIFLENVISEVSELFPFGYIHLGGDEIPKGAWKRSPAVHKLMKEKRLKNTKEVQNYFFTRLDMILAKHDRKMIAWQEVIEGKPKLREENILMAWKSPKAGMNMIKQKRDVIMAPVQYLYFDQQYTRTKKEPGHTWSTPVSTQKTYSFNVNNSPHISGVQACLWSETLLTEKIADYLAWPRIFALAEVAWTAQKSRNWKEFQQRASTEGLKRLKAQEIHFRPIVPIR